MDKTDPLEYFREYSFNWTEEELRKIHQSIPPSDGLVRFFNALEDFVFCVFVSEDENNFLLVYAEYRRDFYSIGVQIPIEDHNLSNQIVVVLARRISDINPDKDFVDIYNMFQYQRQGMLEALGYVTFNPYTAPKGGTLFSAGRKIVPVEIIDRIDFLKVIYQDTIDKPHLDPENKIYLMVDNTNGLIKIGRSKKPEFREGTLQSKQPAIHLIAVWTAPASIEKVLHRKYASLKKRGEWFRLSLKELDEIKEYMDSL